MKKLLIALFAFYAFVIGYDLYYQDYRSAIIICGVLSVSVLAGVLGALT